MPLYRQIQSHCVDGCTCDDEQYFPICGDDGRSYFSPCHAGCTGKSLTDFFNCTCIPSGHAESGLCDQGCNGKLYAYAVFTFVGKLFTAFKIVPTFIAQIRCVQETDRAASTAFASFVTSALGWMPGPIIFGAIIDDTCLLWKYTCGERQSCRLYDLAYFRNAILGYSVITSALATLILSSLFFYFRYKNTTEWQQGAQKEDLAANVELIVNTDNANDPIKER
ncbi:hypothetical protein DPMN_069637 [Dreissena polymorpha]|uniref:Kazal-like domain-containing protein n=2 Tax=Dreissena polymorpha TaxID=45954 RepID=A0A9D3YZD8_DREPO|nr:hypothetical protein DPMN_069637 [Dreissena polymorpha]